MQQIPEDPRSVSGRGLEPGRQLAGGGNKIERIARHSKALVEDVKAWVDLKIRHTRLEIEAELEAKKNELALLAGVGVIGLLAVVFGLTALALALGAWLGHPAWGFLIVTVLLLLLAGLLYVARGPRRSRKREVVVEPKEAAPPPAPGP